jgi:hypothetical protein
MCRTAPFPHAEGMNTMMLLYAPLAAVFAAFVVYGGIVMPVREIADSFRERRRSEGEVTGLPIGGGQGSVRAGNTA